MLWMLWLFACEGSPDCGVDEVVVVRGSEASCELACDFGDTGVQDGGSCPEGLVCVAEGSSCRSCKDLVYHCVEED